MRLDIQIIDHNAQRYETCGDWWVDAEGVVQVRVSHLSDRKYEYLILIHELTEMFLELAKRRTKLTRPNRIVQPPPHEVRELQELRLLTEETDRFDQRYEASRSADDNESEPGCEPDCPVYQGHMAASAIENIAAMVLEVNYNKYAEEVGALKQTKGESNG